MKNLLVTLFLKPLIDFLDISTLDFLRFDDRTLSSPTKPYRFSNFLLLIFYIISISSKSNDF